MVDAAQRERYLSAPTPSTALPTVPRPVRSVFRYGATRVLEAQRALTEWQLAHARLVERQASTLFELHRVGLEAGLRFTEAATRALVGAAPSPAGSAPRSAG